MSAEAYCSRMPSTAGLTPEFDEPLRQCPMCGSSPIENYDHDYEGRRVDRCQGCHLLFMNPQYTARYLDRYYANYGQRGDDVLRIPDPNDLSERRTAAKADAIKQLARYTKPGRLLSIGCYDGIELLLAKQHGWLPEGYDVDAATMQMLRKQVDFPIYTGDFFGLGLPANHYDCVYMDQVLEHPKNPQDYLREVHRILAPGGLLYIGCPNIKSISSRLKTLLGKLGLKRRRGKHYDMFHHLFFYDPRTLAKIMETHYGYEVVVTEGDPVIGLKTVTFEENWRTGLGNWVRRKFPICESSFRLLARKPADTVSQTGASRAA